MKPIVWVPFVFVLVGALNWGLIGFFGFDLVAALFGTGSLAAQVVYDAVGVSALLMIIVAPKLCRGSRM